MNRVVTFAVALAALAWPLTPANAEDFWIKDKTSGCLIWSDEAVGSRDSITWSGTCKGGIAAGKGKLSWTQGGTPAGTYEGFMAEGKLNGLGVLSLAVKGGTNKLVGIFKNGDLNGGGLFKDAAGNMYEGDIKNGKPHETGYPKIGKGILDMRKEIKRKTIEQRRREHFKAVA